MSSASVEQALSTSVVQPPLVQSECSADTASTSWYSRLAESVLMGQLSKLTRGSLQLRFGCRDAVFGNTESAVEPAIVNIHSERFFSRLLTDGSLGAAESYLEDEWSSPDLTSVFRVLLQNEDVVQRFRPSRFSPTEILRRIAHLRNRNSESGSRRNIHEHYDLGNEFFSTFLDPSMMYSSAVFPSDSADLETASWEKVDRVCRRLELSPSDHVVEIGTGWGGFALHAASKYGCQVTTTTISKEQFDFASERIRNAGLEDRVKLLQEDYRNLEGRFDKLVSLEMIEAVGREFLPEYFRTCSRLLKSDGAMMIQAITMPEQRYERYTKSVDFIQKYIFPGGFLPSVSEMQQCVHRETNLRMLDLQDYGVHYAKTLNEWNGRFHERLDDVRAQGFSERFIRMWRYYLCYCEAAFLERATGLAQIVWAKPDSSLGRL